jgi:hypothetical protein
MVAARASLPAGVGTTVDCNAITIRAEDIDIENVNGWGVEGWKIHPCRGSVSLRRLEPDVCAQAVLLQHQSSQLIVENVACIVSSHQVYLWF